MRGLIEIARANRAGVPLGLPAYCTAHPETLRAILRCYADDYEPLLIEVDAAAVNLGGGYAGMTPGGFRNFIEIMAAGEGVDPARLILGAARVGTGLWKTEPVASAMTSAAALIRAYVEAGFVKLHLDASSACADDETVSPENVAGRTAALCWAAEAAAQGRPVLYALGGASSARAPGTPATPAEARQLFDLHQQAFGSAGIGTAFERVIALVLESGAGYTNAAVLPFLPGPLAGLAQMLPSPPSDAVFQAPATDYQDEAALRALVAAHFAILEVGPELANAFGRAVVAMAHLEAHLSVRVSDVLAVIEKEMLRDPAGWQDQIPDDDRAAAMRLFGLTGPLRAYWARPPIAAALQRLFANIDAARPEAGLLAQYAPPASRLPDRLPLSQRIIAEYVGTVVQRYRRAARA
ncbi:MAG: class II D-tagatose-bisphosphate aldolase, non-catalytic subunit [Devosia sp.]|nr:class II D-tagatose-bisphosphate aldolase, non-catalytic subunit [Devosia sp.]